MQRARQITATTAVTVILLLLALAPCAFAQSADANLPPSLVEVYWQSSKTVVLQGITNLIVLDPEITRAETGYGTVQFFGLQRGETVVLGYMNDKPVSIRVRVVARPVYTPSPALLRRQAELAHGLVGSDVQIFNNPGTTSFALLNNFSWSQLAGGNGRLEIAAQAEDNNNPAGHIFNIRNGSVVFQNPGLELHALDFAVSLTNNAPLRFVSPYTVSETIQVRGAELALNRGDNRYLFFGGTTLPFYFLTLSSTRDVGGFSFMRKQSDNLSLFATSSYINTPTNFLGLSGRRENGFMQTAGFSYLLDKRWSFQATGGGGSHGGMGRAEADYVTHNLAFFVAGSKSSTLFPLNQLFSLFSDNASVKSGLTLRTSARFTEAVFYQHAVTDPFGNVIHAGSSDYLTPALTYKINRSHDLIFTYTYSHNEGGFANRSSTGNRFDTNWHYQLAPLISNNAQVTVGSVQDPLQLNSDDEFTFRDSLSFPVRGGSMLLAFEDTRRNPSLVQKLSSELNLLSPALQTLFLADPIGFVQSDNLPPEVRALLQAQVPVNTSVYAAGQFHLGKKITFSPNFSLARATSGASETWTPFAGYNLMYAATPSLRLTSGLSNVWTFNSQLNAAQRVTLFSFGLVKTFSAMPASLLPARHPRIIEGRVFRDNNVNGIFNAGDQGLGDLRLELDSGEFAITDEQGRYKFTGVSAGEHGVSLSLTQFPGPVRMTTRSEASVDLIQRRIAIVDFGVVNFARLSGNIFNDLRFEGKRQPDSKAVPDVHLILEGGRIKRTIVAENGEYEVDDVPPGDYKLSIDPATLPANFVAPTDTFALRVAPVSSVVQDVPLHALRSISGRVLLKIVVHPRGDGAQQGSGSYKLLPLAGVQLRAVAGTTATAGSTDENGNFLLRNLPAGDITVSVVPVKPLPPGMKAPSGPVHLPPEPIQVQGATIVITNTDLVPYLTEVLPLNEGAAATDTAARR
jgi:SdrD B-like domain